MSKSTPSGGPRDRPMVPGGKDGQETMVVRGLEPRGRERDGIKVNLKETIVTGTRKGGKAEPDTGPED